MAALSFTAAKISADPMKGAVIISRKSVAAVDIGELVYINSDGLVALAQADGTLAEASAVGVVIGLPDQYGATVGVAGQWVSVCVFGEVYGFSGLVEGSYGFVSNTAGAIEDAAGAARYVVGQATAADTFFVRPGLATPYQ